MSSRSEGFTVAELLVALTAGSLLLILAHAVLIGVLDAAERGGAAAAGLTRHGNRTGWLTRAFGSTATDFDQGYGFVGLSRTRDGREADEVRWHSVIRVGQGRGVRGLRLGLDETRRLVVVLSAPGADGTSADTLVLRESVLGFGADYLSEYGAGAHWVAEFVSPASAPLAVRLRMLGADGRTDTLLLHIGARG